MHTAAYRHLGLPHVYEAVRVAVADLPRWIDAIRSRDVAGANVTIPHKQAILDHVDRLDPSATATRAANTLVRAADGGVVAHNTDAAALIDEITAAASPNAPFRTVIVIGSGGAARAA